MLLRFSCATFLGLASIVGTDAFIAPSPSRTKYASTVLGVSGIDDDGDEEVGSSSERFRALKAAAAQAQQAGEIRPVAIDNPFLTPPPTPQVQPPNPADLSVEEQARLFREMMQGGDGAADAAGAAAASPYPTPNAQRVAKTDRAGRPRGRNRDADAIANSSDVYFAQLKRDSTVRTLARIRGDDDTAQAVFEDDGIEELSNLLQTNPYLKAQRDEEASLIDQVPDSMKEPYMEDKKNDEDLASAGVKWKDMVKNRRKGKGGQSSSPPAEATRTQSEATVAQTEPQPAEPTTPIQPEPAVVTQPEPATQQPIAQQQTTVAAVPAPAPVEEQNSTQVAASAPPATPEEARQKIRTLMGMLLKHRGGPGFGKGRLNGPDITRFESLFDEVTAMLRNEALLAAPVNADLTPVPASPEPVPATPQTIPEPPPTVPAPVSVSPPQATAPVQSNPSTSVGSDLSQVDGIILCIEGANTMFKNSPPELKPSVLISLRAALMAAVGTCNNILGNEITLPSSAASSDMSQIDSSVACIEGAIAMYKNSPSELKESVLVTLRAALVSAVNTCDAVSGTAAPQQQSSPPAAEPAPAVPSAVPETPVAPKVQATDPNSKKLEVIYNSLEAASGDGPLGLRSDLTSGEAKELEKQIVEMRGILMNEMEAGIPDSDTDQPNESASGSSTVSKYKDMLAKAKADKVGI